MSIVVPGMAEIPELRMDGALPPDLEGTFFRIGPSGAGGGDEGELPGTVCAIELREGKAVSYRQRFSEADANVLWHAGKVLGLPESGRPSQFTRELEAEEFGGGLGVDVASHLKRDAVRGRRVLFGVDEGAETTTLRLGEWGPDGALVGAQTARLERATWQHDIAVTASQIVFIESPTEPLGSGAAVDYRWVPSAEGWVGCLRRADVVAEDAAVQWASVDPCVVTHVMGAADEGGGEGGGVVLYAVVYPAPEPGQPVDLGESVVGPEGIGRTPIGGGLGVLERWRVGGGRVERKVVDERWVEYPRVDALCEGASFRYGYCVEMGWGAAAAGGGVAHLGLLRMDVVRDEVAVWQTAEGLTASEPVFVRAADGRSDDEGWVLTVVDDALRGGSDLYVLDASSFGRRRPEAVIHLPDGVRLPFRSHGEWVGADRYR